MKTILTTLILILSMFALNAQEENNSDLQKRFIGTWQRCILNKDIIKVDTITKKIDVDTINIKTFNIYKYFGKGGDFNALYVNAYSSSVAITGTYEVYSDKYIENVNHHFDPDLANKRVELPYLSYGENYLIMSYMNGTGMSFLEVWKRVPLQDATEQQ